jgi:hypothetical protein
MDYGRWGFRGSPFQQTSLPPDLTGRQLLVGRTKELSMLEDRLRGTRKAVVLEGLNGIGKTSVVNVAAFSLYDAHLKGKIPALYIPCRKTFQLRVDLTSADFVEQVLFEVAQTLIERQSDLLKSEDRPLTASFERWLNSPELKSFQGGLYVVSAGIQSNQNTGAGFERSGFRRLITEALKKLFPDESDGGVVCCIDNLELLQTSEEAKRRIEELRDELLQIQGLRWVLCGALGITYAFATSPRLDGYLHRPIVLKEVDSSFAPEVLTSRTKVFAEKTAPYLPILERDFDLLYKILRGNLRNVLSYTDNYCQSIADSTEPATEAEKHAAFMNWLVTEAEAAHNTAVAALTPTTVTVFKRACATQTFAPSDYKAFGFETPQALRNYIKSLETVDLIVSVRDDSDKRRKTIQVTPKGWLVNFKIEQDAQGNLALQ